MSNPHIRSRLASSKVSSKSFKKQSIQTHPQNHFSDMVPCLIKHKMFICTYQGKTIFPTVTCFFTLNLLTNSTTLDSSFRLLPALIVFAFLMTDLLTLTFLWLPTLPPLVAPCITLDVETTLLLLSKATMMNCTACLSLCSGRKPCSL